nr:hypothetical protein [Micromonospora rosaria]
MAFLLPVALGSKPVAACDLDDLAGDPPGLVGGEEDGGVGDVSKVSASSASAALLMSTSTGPRRDST